MDEEKRKIERAASEGDLDAQRRLNILKVRTGEKFSLNKPAGISWMKWLRSLGYKATYFNDGHSPRWFFDLKGVFCLHNHSGPRAAFKCAKRHLYSEMKKVLLS